MHHPFEDADLSDTPRADIPPLGLLIKQYNAMLGWTQSDLARATGKDPSEISKIVSGATSRPHGSTLATLAAAYRAAGLEGVSAEHLRVARDAYGEDGNPWGIPSHWLRLVRSVLVLEPDVADALYRMWSQQLAEFSRMLASGLHFDPHADDYDD